MDQWSLRLWFGFGSTSRGMSLSMARKSTFATVIRELLFTKTFVLGLRIATCKRDRNDGAWLTDAFLYGGAGFEANGRASWNFSVRADGDAQHDCSHR